jgi:hypothetical protein
MTAGISVVVVLVHEGLAHFKPYLVDLEAVGTRRLESSVSQVVMALQILAVVVVLVL